MVWDNNPSITGAKEPTPLWNQAQAIYLAASLAEARRAFLRLKWVWQSAYPALIRRLEQDLPELLSFYHFPRSRWRKLRTTNAIERCFVEVRRRTRPMVVFTNVTSVDRIIYAIFSSRNEQWRNRTLGSAALRVAAAPPILGGGGHVAGGSSEGVGL